LTFLRETLLADPEAAAAFGAGFALATLDALVTFFNAGLAAALDLPAPEIATDFAAAQVSKGGPCFTTIYPRRIIMAAA